MIFTIGNKKYVAATAAQIVSEMAREAQFESAANECAIGDFLRARVAVLADDVHPRELDFSRHLTEEMLAFNYLCLLDEYGLGKLVAASAAAPDSCFENVAGE
jgi:hypothetical protein